MTGSGPTTTQDRRAWSVEFFAAFWRNPDPRMVEGVLTDDVVGLWAGREDPVRGPEEYTRCVAALVQELPDVRLAMEEHAQSGDLTFVRWTMHATGQHGPFEIGGIDRVRQQAGLVAENVIVFDTAAFESRSGRPVPWR